MTSFFHTTLAAFDALCRCMYALLSLLWTHGIALVVCACTQSSCKAYANPHAQLFFPIEVKISLTIWRLGKNNFLQLRRLLPLPHAAGAGNPKSSRGSAK